MASKDTQASTAERKRAKVRIGVVFSMKELELKIEGEAEAIAAGIDATLASDAKSLVLDDGDGKRVIVPVDKLCYVEIHGEARSAAIGFGS